MTSHIPKISTFSGDTTKQDTSYDLWRYEVDCLVKEKYSEAVIAQAIRRSLRGDAGKVAMRLGSDAKVNQILDKMESVYGTIERGETKKQEFYSEIQRKTEDSMSWSCGLEEIYRKAIVKGVAMKQEENEKLRSKYWNSLHQWLRDITGYKYDTIKDFDELRREIRLIEKEHNMKRTHTNMAVTSDTQEGNEYQELKGMIQQLSAKVTQLERGNQRNDKGNQQHQQRQQPLQQRKPQAHDFTSNNQQRGLREKENYQGNNTIEITTKDVKVIMTIILMSKIRNLSATNAVNPDI
ncbi:hypothetical protein FSP39_024397 [Pinctada imbricata]|uniref:Uncharacterized protein n=1 Tax=Pinctada imbricata TaxID=66713 RepID=A0AA88YGF4_PINIB|nr:hypothetical protein FSP39_024397 [Pinctada imbricata]